MAKTASTSTVALPAGTEVRVNKDGTTTYTYRYREGGRGSKQIRKSFRTPSELLRFVADLAEGKTTTPRSSTSPEATVRELISHWWDEEVRAVLAEKTRDNYKRLLKNYLLPKLGDLPIAELSQAAVRRFRNELVAAETGDTTINECLKVLSSCCGWHIESGDGWIEDNPCSGIKRRKVVSNRDKKQALSPLQIARIAYAMPTLRDRLIVLILGFEGLRWVELSSLRWRDLLDDTGAPRRRFQVVRSKTESGLRPPVFFEPLHEIVIAYWHECGSPSGDTLVFGTRSGAPLSDHNWRAQVWVEVMGTFEKATGADHIRYRVPSALRRSCATMLLYAGWHVRKVADHLGHADHGVTLLKEYADVINDAEELAVHVAPEDQIRQALADVKALAGAVSARSAAAATAKQLIAR